MRLRIPVALVVAICLLATQTGYTQIRRWDTGEVIPGTEFIDIKDLGIDDLSNWNTPSHNLRFADLSSLDLSSTTFASSDLTGADFSGSNLNLADFTNSRIEWARFYDGRLSSEQLYSTASYRNKSLIGISFIRMDLSDWDLSDQNLMWSTMGFFGAGVNLDGTILDGANLKYSRFGSAWPTIHNELTLMNQWTCANNLHRSCGKDSGLPFTLMNSRDGDLNDDNEVTASDIDFIRSRAQHTHIWDDYNPALDFHNDLLFPPPIDVLDLEAFVHNVFKTWMGDANGDGLFNSGDLVNVFAAGEYDDALRDNSSWMSGDWNADGEYTSSDLVVAFQDGGYEAGPRVGMVAVPEPTCIVLLMMGVCGMRGILRSRTVR